MLPGIPSGRSATLSPCGRYRYALGREVGPGDGAVLFVGVNPSTADHEVDDHTARKWRGFALRWGFSSFVAGNLFAWRATDVADLEAAEDPVGPENDAHLRRLLVGVCLVVPCWGKSSKLPLRLLPRIEVVRGLLATFDGPVKCLGRTRSGDPRHPLTLSYSTALEDWP
jgi:hypothetical protein